MAVLFALLAAGAFVGLLRFFGMVKRSREVVAITGGALQVIGNSTMSDDEKEVAMQRDAVKLFRLFVVLSVTGAASLLLPFGAIWIAQQMGLVSISEVIEVSLSPWFLCTAAIASIGAMAYPGQAKTDATGTSSYSTTDQLMHRIAFATRDPQIAFAALEDRVFRAPLSRASCRRAVFVTGLPRAGTTVLLEILSKLPEFAAHCYRDMPFTLMPLFWNRFSKRFQQKTESKERSHGDGMLINPDSPEALEEVLWLSFWKEHYEKDRVALWNDEPPRTDFARFFESHMRKVIVLRRPESPDGARYISKNNLNIARTPLLRRLFEDAVILVPFRRPLDHAASLLTQHLNFLKLHHDDAFASEYMREIGHFDFGENLRPIDFGKWLDGRKTQDATSLGFWLEYWIAAYQHLLTQDIDLHFCNYDALCENPASGLTQLAQVLDCSDTQGLQASGSQLRPAKARAVDTYGVADDILRRAHEVHMRLIQVALNPPSSDAGVATDSDGRRSAQSTN